MIEGMGNILIPLLALVYLILLVGNAIIGRRR